MMEITVKNLQSKFSIPSSQIETIALKACRTLKLLKHKSAISIVMVGSARMRTINKTYLKHDYVTDVITFDLAETGEIIICPYVAHQNAKAYQETFKKELLLYVIHGLLHLAGYDDHKPQDIKAIRAKEAQLLNQFL